MPNFSEYLGRMRREHGAKFSASALDRRFVPYFESGERISVKFYGTEVKRGTVGATGGWQPVFLLMLRSSDIGSSWTIGRDAQIVPHVPKRKPKKPRMLFNPKSKWWTAGFGAGVEAAKVNVDIDPDEMIEAIEKDRVGEIAGDIRESQSQYAGDIVYDIDRKGGPTVEQFEKWENGFYKGFQKTVEKWGKTAKRKPRMLFNG
jgi:hypothetical protein